jgi:hypothetical protein
MTKMQKKSTKKYCQIDKTGKKRFSVANWGYANYFIIPIVLRNGIKFFYRNIG